MVGTKENTKKADLHYVNPKDETEIVYLHSKYPWINEKEIKSVIERQGPERKHIEECLDRYHS